MSIRMLREGILAISLLAPAVAAADSCPVPLFREHRPGPWPPAILTDAPLGAVTDSPHVDPDPAPPGTPLTFYRLGDPGAPPGPLGITLQVERTGDSAVLHWGGGGDAVACCLPGGCEDACPLDCLTMGGAPSTDGALCSDEPSPCAVDPCGAWLDFAGNQVPSGWTVLDRDGNTNVTTPTTPANERLEASPVNAGQRIEADVAIPPGTTELVIEFEAEHLSSQWGCYAEIQLHAPTGVHFVLARNAIFSEGANTMELWTSGPLGAQPTEVVTIEHRPHHHRMLLRDGVAERQIRDLDSGALVADVVQDLPDFVLTDVVHLAWEVYVTTDNATWGDDFRVECRP